MGVCQNSGMDRPAVIQTYGSVWITCVLVWIGVWIGGMDRGYGSACGFRVWIGLYILTRSYTIIMINNIPSMVTHGISNINEIP